jgi:hypothetical protein
MKKYYFLFLIVTIVSFSYSAKAQNFLNGSFESWGNANVCEINVAPDNWINYSVACIAFDEANFNFCPSTIPPNASDGNVYARACAGPDWQGGEGVYQNVSNFNVGQVYTLSFDYAGSNLYGGTDSVRWKVYINDTLVSQTPFCSSLQNTWSNFTYSFIATQSVNKIGFRAYFINPTVTGSGSAGIDNVKLEHEVVTSVSNTQLDNDVKIYPVPLDNTLTVEHSSNDELDVVLLDLNLVEKVKQQFKNKVVLSTANLSKGLYICLVKKKGVVIHRKTLLKL